MDAELLAQLSALIAMPLEMVELLSVGAPVDEKPDLFSVDCHPGTPLVWTFGDHRVVFYCKSGATVGLEIVASEFDATRYFSESLPEDECHSTVKIPIFQFLEGPHGKSFNAQTSFVDSITFIQRQSDDGFNGIAAVVFAFSDSTKFALSAVHESHFCYAFNNYCQQLLDESVASAAHTLHTVHRDGATPMPVDSVLWMVE